MSAPLSRRSAVVAAALVVTYMLTHVSTPAAVEPPSLATLPFELSEWAGVEAPPLDPEIAEVLAADEYVRRFYTGPQGHVVEMDLSYYSQPRVGSTLHSPLNCLPGSGWEVNSMSTRQLATAAGSVGIRELTVQREIGRAHV